MSKKPAILLLSGGLDSTTVLAIAKERGFAPHCITFRYGQRHESEIATAQDIAHTYGAASFQIIELDLRAFGGSALTADVDVPKDRSESDMGQNIPITYVPARNTIFLSFALAKAEVMDSRDIFIGVNAMDYSGYPDCRPAFVNAFQALANQATRAVDEPSRPYTLHAPLMKMTKADIVREGTRLGIDYGKTTSCYDPENGRACGRCDACILRRNGFHEAGIPDPTRYI